MTCFQKQMITVGVIIGLCIWGLIYNIKSGAYSNISMNHDMFFSILEASYLEGQKDALDGDIRIRMDYSRDCYVWVKSPFDGGEDKDDSCILTIGDINTNVVESK
jgi:hypothetical protein